MQYKEIVYWGSYWKFHTKIFLLLFMGGGGGREVTDIAQKILDGGGGLNHGSDRRYREVLSGILRRVHLLYTLILRASVFLSFHRIYMNKNVNAKKSF